MAHIRWIAGWSAILKLIGAQIWCVIPWSGCLIYRILVCVCVFPTHLNLSMIYIYIYIIIYMIYDNIGRVFVLVNYCMYPTHEFVLLFAFVDPIEDGCEGNRPIFVVKLNWRMTNLHAKSHCVWHLLKYWATATGFNCAENNCRIVLKSSSVCRHFYQ